jgi:glutamyl-tRNA synthetase
LKVKSINWSDEVRGQFDQDIGLIEDFILIKSDGFPTYNFANVVDDHDMKISHVIRGDEFIASTAKHAMLYDLQDWPRPRFVHLPVINGPDGKKLSKRNGDTDVLDYKAKGYLPAALLNFLALLGWHPGSGDTQEVFSLSQLIKEFDLDGLQKSPAVFDPERLDWMNGLYLRAMEPEELLDAIIEFLGSSALAALLQKDRNYALGAVSLVQERLKRLDEAAEQLGFFFTDPNPKALDYGKLPPAEVKKALQLSLEQIKSHPELFNDASELENFMRTEVAAQLGDKPGPTFMALRIALTGETATPGLFETMVALGPETVERRLSAAISTLL